MSSTESVGAKGKSDVFLFDPEDLVLVVDKSSTAYDERVHMALDEALVNNVAVNGVIVPIVYRVNGKDKDGRPNVEVIDGRQRVRAAREVNKRFKKEGKVIRVPGVRGQAENKEAYVGLMISANELRQDDGPMVKAQKLQRYLKFGYTEKDAAVAFGVTLATVQNMLKLLALAPAAQKMVAEGDLPASVAKELAEIPQEKQEEALTKMVAEGAIRGARGVKAAKAARTGKPIPAKMQAVSAKGRDRALDALRSAMESFPDHERVAAEVILQAWRRIGGDEGALSDFPLVDKCINGALAPQPRGRKSMTAEEKAKKAEEKRAAREVAKAKKAEAKAAKKAAKEKAKQDKIAAKAAKKQAQAKVGKAVKKSKRVTA